jgi:hypothetical protein
MWPAVHWLRCSVDCPVCARHLIGLTSFDARRVDSLRYIVWFD